MRAIAKRRGLLGGTAFLAAGVLPAVARAIEAPNADAVLIALAADFDNTEIEEGRFASRPRTLANIDACDALTGRLGQITRAAVEIEARTHDGLVAKARMLRSSISYATREVDAVATWQHDLAWSIARDLLEGASA